MNWQDDIVRRTLECAGDYPGVQLQLLLMRLEGHPEALPAIAAAIRDMGKLFQDQADALEAEGRRHNGGAAIVRFPQ